MSKKILLTGATGYIGKRLLPVLVSQGYRVVCCVREQSRFNPPDTLKESLDIIEVDFLKEATIKNIPSDIDGAYYLIHSMSSSEDFSAMELACAENFKKAVKNTQLKHVIYLSGIINEENLSEHLASRKAVENTLREGNYHFTTLRAGIIIGSGSASYEIIRDLVEKLPVMITPKWLNTRCQPIGIRDVIQFLFKTLFNPETYDQSFDIGGQDILTYKEMLLGYAKVRKLNRWIYVVPVMTPKLSSYWLYFITSTSYQLASSLVDSMKIEVVCKNDDINQILDIQPSNYETALKRTLLKIENNAVVSSWKDALISGKFDLNLSDYIQVPTYGCFVDQRSETITNRDRSIDRIWKIGGKTGWYYATWLWKIRGYLDKLVGGVGLRRGRTHPNHLAVGDAVDFWRVLYANKEEGRLLLFAEMKLPGEAWLEFKVKDEKLVQTATFRPWGVWGRVYWYLVFPFHGLIFNGMLTKLTE